MQNNNLNDLGDKVTDSANSVKDILGNTVVSAKESVTDMIQDTSSNVSNSVKKVAENNSSMSYSSGNSNGSMMITDSKTIKMFESLSFWSKFFSVLGYITVFFLIIGAIIYGFVAIAISPVLVIVPLVYLILAVVQVWLSIKLWKIGSSVNQTKQSSNQDSYNQNSLLAFQDFQQYAKFNGILTLVSFLAIPLLFFVIFAAAIADGFNTTSLCKNSEFALGAPEICSSQSSYPSSGIKDKSMSGDYMNNPVYKNMTPEQKAQMQKAMNGKITTPDGNINFKVDDKNINIDINGIQEGVVPTDPASSITLPKTN
jgi:hypothetical protein